MNTCDQHGKPLLARVLRIQDYECWVCGKPIKVAYRSDGSYGLWEGDYTDAEKQFAVRHGVKIRNRYSHTAGARYEVNVC